MCVGRHHWAALVAPLRRLRSLRAAVEGGAYPADATVPLARLAANPHVLTVVTPRGGHLGYGAADGALPCAPSWSDELVARWFAAVDADAAPRAPSARL